MSIEKNVSKVLERLSQLVLSDLDLAIEIGEAIDPTINDWHMNDGFGTEGQCDPRGDFRKHNDWCIWGRVED